MFGKQSSQRKIIIQNHVTTCCLHNDININGRVLKRTIRNFPYSCTSYNDILYYHKKKVVFFEFETTFGKRLPPARPLKYVSRDGVIPTKRIKYSCIGVLLLFTL